MALSAISTTSPPIAISDAIDKAMPSTLVVMWARPADAWWVAAGDAASLSVPGLGWLAAALQSHATEVRRVGMLAALFLLGGFAYLGTLYCFGYRLRDVKR